MEIKFKDFNMGTYCGVGVYWDDNLQHAIRFKKPKTEVTLPEIIEALTTLHKWHENKVNA